jgi:hypothetical protein
MATMTSERPEERVHWGLPVSIMQAMDDVHLTQTARLAMWHLRLRLDVVEYREVKLISLASEMREKERNIGNALALLVARGYLEQTAKRKPREFRLLWSRRRSDVRAA